MTAAVIAAALLIGLGVALDIGIAGWDDRPYRADALAQSVRSLFMPLGKADLVLTVVAALGALGLRRRATAALVALTIAAVLVTVVKPAVARPRPNGEPGALPSGDTATVAAALTPFAAATPVAWAPTVAAVAGVGAFRVLDRMHHPLDVAIGAIVGFASGWAGLAAVRRRRQLPSSRLYLAAAGIGAAAAAAGALAGSSERFVTALMVVLPPLVVLLAGRWLAPWLHRSRLGSHRRPAATLVALAALVLALTWLAASGSTLWDRDEPRFARASVEMVESGDWLVPTFNDRLRPDKPAGIYWLMATSVRLFGATEWSVRMWAGLGLAAAMLLVGGFVRRRVDGASPVLAAAVVGLSPLAFVVGTAATTDAVLLAAVTAAMVALAGGLMGRWTVGRVVVLGVLLGAAQLIKGPVGLAVPGLAAIAWTLVAWRRGEDRWRSDLGAVAAAVGLGLAVFLAWALPADAASGGELARQGLGHHVLERMQRPLESHGGGFLTYLPYYPAVLLVGLAPWSIYLPGAVDVVWRHRLGSSRLRRLLLCWSLPTVALMTVVATKLPHYVLPVVPALAIIIAVAVAAINRRPELAAGFWWASGRWLVLGLGLSVAAATAVGVWWLPVPELRRHLIGIAAVIAVTSVAAFIAHRRNRHHRLLAVLTAAAVVVVVQTRVALPVLETVKPAPVIARAVREAVPPEVPVAAAGFKEPSLAFYLGRSFVELNRRDIDLWLARPADGVLITEERLLPDGRHELEEIARFSGINISNGEHVEVVAVRRGAAVRPRPG